MFSSVNISSNLTRHFLNITLSFNVALTISFYSGGGCSAPVAISTSLSPLDDKLCLKVTGGVWSLNGQTELTEADKCTVEIKKNVENEKVEKPISVGYGSGEPSKLDTNTKTAAKCPYDTKSYETPCKRQKIEDKNENDTTKKSLNLLNDPHEHCPYKIPVGLDFMGKCPYLDSQGQSKCPFNAEILGTVGEHSQHVTKCPYMVDGKLISTDVKIEKEENKACPYREPKLYVGIVPCKKTPLWALEQAEHLGINLAEKLLKKGALEVMQAAQAVIRGN